MELSASAKRQAREDVGEYLIEQVLLSLSKARSPVVGESWPGLSKEYKERKIAEGGSGKPDMELLGEMLDSLTFKSTDEGIELGFFDKQAWKADGHLKFSGEENNTPQRRFLPAEGQAFKPEIQKEAERIVAEAFAEDVSISRAELRAVESTTELYEVLAQYLAGSRAQIRQSVLSTSLADLLADMDLLELL